MFRGLEFAIRPLAGPALAPVTAVTAGLGLEGHLGKALAGLAGHDFVAMPADPVQAGRAAIEGKADGVEDGALPRAGRAGDGEDAVSDKGRMRQVDLPFAGQ